MKKELNVYYNMITFLGKSLGNYYSTVLFEYENNQFNSVATYNEETISIEKIISFMNEHLKKNNQDIMNDNIQFDLSKLDKISIQFIKDEQDHLIGAFCITMKCMPFIKMNRIIHEFLNFNIDSESSKTYPLTLEGIDEYITDYGITNKKPNKNERIEIICDLYDLGMFNIKGAINHVADRLQVSPKSVYRYVYEIKQNRDEE